MPKSAIHYPFLSHLTVTGVVLASCMSPIAQASSDGGVLTRVGRYAVISAAPTAGQKDLLADRRVRVIPASEKTIGEALRWLLKDSGYRLVDEAVLSEEAAVMLTLPLPAVHRQFQALPLHHVVALIVGPAFTLVKDPVHRLLAFERCRGAASTALNEISSNHSL